MLWSPGVHEDETKRFRSKSDDSEPRRMEQLGFIRGPEKPPDGPGSAAKPPDAVEGEGVPGLDPREQVVTALAHVGERRGGRDRGGPLDVGRWFFGPGDWVKP